MPNDDIPIIIDDSEDKLNFLDKNELMETDVDESPEKIQEKINNLAEQKKNQGNDEYSKKNYIKAINLYSDAINLNPLASYYGNRAAAYVMLEKYDKAIDDSRMALQIDPTFHKASLREAKCHLLLGEIGASIHIYKKFLQLQPDHSATLQELRQAEYVEKMYKEAQESSKKQDFRTALYNYEKCMEVCSGCTKFRVLKAECLINLKRPNEAFEIVSDVLRIDSRNLEAIFIRGLCLYYNDNCEKALQHFKNVLEFAPDHKKAMDSFKKVKSLMQKKEEGNQKFKENKFQEALKLYSEALQIDPLNTSFNSKLYSNRATIHHKMHNLKEAIKDYSEAIKLDSIYIKAFIRRAKCYMESEEYEEAVRDYETICQLDKSKEYKRLLKEAKLELKKSKRKDYYKILKLNKSASEDEIKKAYKKHALLHHPDRHAHASEEEKKEEEKKFKEVGEAYSVLSDPKKKRSYDSGQDLEEINNGFSSNTVDPNIIFQSFFGGSNGGFSFSSSEKFPGSFQFRFG